jgi:hypothetical protein
MGCNQQKCEKADPTITVLEVPRAQLTGELVTGSVRVPGAYSLQNGG